MQLQEVDPVGLQALERPVDLPPRVVTAALAGLRRQEDVVADAWHPRSKAQLGVAVVSRHIEVVDARVQCLLDRPVSDVLADVADGERAVDQNRALVLEAAESSSLHVLPPSARAMRLRSLADGRLA